VHQGHLIPALLDQQPMNLQTVELTQTIIPRRELALVQK
jgi:hypothetical protein